MEEKEMKLEYLFQKFQQWQRKVLLSGRGGYFDIATFPDGTCTATCHFGDEYCTSCGYPAGHIIENFNRESYNRLKTFLIKHQVL